MSFNLPFKYTFKYILLGDYNTGKTAITDRFIHNNYDNLYRSTIGVDYHVKNINIDDICIKICIWDTSGQERFRSITESYLKDITCAILTFDFTSRKTFYNLEYWLKKVKDYNKNIIIILLGTKVDKFKKIEINEDEINYFVQNNNLHYFETSSKNNVNIHEVFNYSASLILQKINYKIINESNFKSYGIRDSDENKYKNITNEKITFKPKNKIKCCTVS